MKPFFLPHQSAFGKPLVLLVFVWASHAHAQDLEPERSEDVTVDQEESAPALDESPAAEESPGADEPPTTDEPLPVLEESDPEEPSPAPREPLRATVSPEPAPVESTAEPRAVATAGLDPTTPQADQGSIAGTAIEGDGDWKMQYHGFLRAPFRMSIGPRNDLTEGTEEHSPPRIPDLSFTDWRYTHNAPGPWTQLLFSYGNSRATGTVGIAAFNQTNAGYRDLQANLGINEAFLTLRFPEALGPLGGLVLNVGSFSNRYGTAGKYNAGKYNTYLFGRTRVVGETITAGLHLSRNVVLTLEHGVGGKLDVVPAETVNPRPEYLPYAGPEAQGTTWVHHGHVLTTLFKQLTLGAHYLKARSPDDRQLVGVPSNPGSMLILGGEIKADLKAFGHGYIGYSHIDAEEILSLSDAIEVLHSFQGWNFKNNFFGRYDPRTGEQAPDTSGTVDTILFQYDLSIGALARLPARFLGNAPDVELSVFGMFNRVNSDNNSHDKFKWGADVVYTPLSFLGIGARYDLVQPDLRDNQQSFAIVSPKILINTQWVSKEQVTFQYSRYFAASRVYPAFPYADIDEIDKDLFMIIGRMWW